MSDRSKKLNLITEWITFSFQCIKENMLISIISGLIFVGAVNLLVMGVDSTTYTDISLPIAGIAILIFGPIMALNLYLTASRYHQKIRNYEKDSTISADSMRSVFFVSFCLLILMLLYLMMIPSIYAISSDSIIAGIGLKPMLSEIPGNPFMAFAIGIWSAFMGWVAFSISWFSYPMIVSNKISGAKAIIYSIKMSYSHFPLLLAWVVVVVSLVGISLISPYFLGFALTIPVLAYSTFDCNRILSREVKELNSDTSDYDGKLDTYCN
jgi:uncharacterized membrane protein